MPTCLRHVPSRRRSASTPHCALPAVPVCASGCPCVRLRAVRMLRVQRIAARLQARGDAGEIVAQELDVEHGANLTRGDLRAAQPCASSRGSGAHLKLHSTKWIPACAGMTPPIQRFRNPRRRDRAHAAHELLANLGFQSALGGFVEADCAACRRADSARRQRRHRVRRVRSGSPCRSPSPFMSLVGALRRRIGTGREPSSAMSARAAL